MIQILASAFAGFLIGAVIAAIVVVVVLLGRKKKKAAEKVHEVRETLSADEVAAKKVEERITLMRHLNLRLRSDPYRNNWVMGAFERNFGYVEQLLNAFRNTDVSAHVRICVERTVDVYLPNQVNAYLAVGHEYREGQTEVVLSALSALEEKMKSMVEKVERGNIEALHVETQFLETIVRS